MHKCYVTEVSKRLLVNSINAKGISINGKKNTPLLHFPSG